MAALGWCTLYDRSSDGGGDGLHVRDAVGVAATAVSVPVPMGMSVRVPVPVAVAVPTVAAAQRPEAPGPARDLVEGQQPPSAAGATRTVAAVLVAIVVHLCKHLAAVVVVSLEVRVIPARVIISVMRHLPSSRDLSDLCHTTAYVMSTARGILLFVGVMWVHNLVTFQIIFICIKLNSA